MPRQAARTAALRPPAEGSPETAGLRRKAVNATAYRIFKLLEWLMAGPLSVEELNARFAADEHIGRTLSNDSIWLYINTLKALGCQITRPCPRNSFRYELLFHPFGVLLDAADMAMLARVKAFGHSHLNRRENLVLDGFLKKVVIRSVGQDAGQTLADRLQALFEESRSLDYGAYLETIDRLEGWIREGALLELAYRSVSKGLSRFRFLPEALVYEQGLLYVRGDRPEYPDPSLLRLDRIQEVKRVHQPELRAQLSERRQSPPLVKIRLLGASDADSLRLEETGFRLEQAEPRAAGVDLHLKGRDLFSLKQRLLSCGLPFQVLAPQAFRQEMQTELETMLAYYQNPEVSDGLG